MRVVMVMFDSLNRHMLPPYGASWVHAPNFERLAGRSATFDRCYAGSLPCMPARRELHTGRYNFLHRSWGPLEPFDDSVPQILTEHGVYTHLVSDHPHYWEDGGATYHTRYGSWEFCRGQEGDPWKGHVADPEIPENIRRGTATRMWRQDWVNRSHMPTEAEHAQTRTFDAGLEFIDTNHRQDSWFCQIETFDPHEPFFSHKPYKDLYVHDYAGPHFDWPDYGRVQETADRVGHARYEYAALVSMCDASLGRVLDAMDEHAMWDDTMLIVCTDHGFLLGDSGWWGKAAPPWLDPLVHTPLFVWDPRTGVRGERRSSLVQTVDLAPTLLDAFDVPPTPDMRGVALRGTVARDVPVREAGLFGVFGGHVCVTDGRYAYLRAHTGEDNGPLFNYTLMPTRMRARFEPSELAGAELAGSFGFTKGAPTLKIPAPAGQDAARFGTLLFDLDSDPGQQQPIADPEVETRMIGLLIDAMEEAEAPAEQYERLGLPAPGSPGNGSPGLGSPIEATHLRATEGQRIAARSSSEAASSEREAALLAALAPAPGPPYAALVAPVRDLLADPLGIKLLGRHVPALVDTEQLGLDPGRSLLELAAAPDGQVEADQLRALLEDLAAE